MTTKRTARFSLLSQYVILGAAMGMLGGFSFLACAMLICFGRFDLPAACAAGSTLALYGMAFGLVAWLVNFVCCWLFDGWPYPRKPR